MSDEKEILIVVTVPDWFEFSNEDTAVELDRIPCDARIIDPAPSTPVQSVIDAVINHGTGVMKVSGDGEVIHVKRSDFYAVPESEDLNQFYSREGMEKLMAKYWPDVVMGVKAG